MKIAKLMCLSLPMIIEQPWMTILDKIINTDLQISSDLIGMGISVK